LEGAIDIENKIQQHNELPGSIAMIVALVSFSMLFATLFLGYSIFRLTSEIWPPAGMARIPLTIPTVSTFIVLLSSFFSWLLERDGFRKTFGGAYYFLAIGTGFAFVGCQFSLWSMLKSLGIFTNSGIYPSMIYAFTWIHTAHMALGLIAFIYLGFLLIGNNWNLDDVLKVQKASSVLRFWHFLAIIWLLMYALLFVL
jgi:cytochrome c oxidase subunit 3